MNKVFMGGSRHVSKLSASVHERIDKVINKGLPIIVGDANGADKAVQQYLFGKRYNNVEVFCSGSVCRNNVGRWPLRHIEASTSDRGAIFFAAKDRAMALEATYGFMIWDGKSTGTLLNVLRLIHQSKKVVVYNASARRFSELGATEQWDHFITPYGVELRHETERKAAIEEETYQDRHHRVFQLLPSQ
jgi:hypothetical protein